jgi:D-sedoheptulose 7-phosphate isomerase
MLQQIKEDIENSIAVKKRVLEDSELLQKIEISARHIVETYRKGGRVFIAGNGGSASDAQHISGELVGRFNFDRKPLSAIALSTDTSILTAVGNDYGYDHIFSRQIEAHGNEKDIFIAISTSGNSKNIIKAVESAKSLGIFVVALSGKDGGYLRDISDISIVAPSNETPRIQETHILIGHILSNLVEIEIFKK